MTIVDNAVYVSGRTTDPEGADETYFLLRQREGMAPHGPGPDGAMGLALYATFKHNKWI